MLELKITLGEEEWDEANGCFILPEETTLRLEHSLISLSKWESKWCKPFLSKTDKTPEEMLDYIKCMTVSKNINPDIYNYLSNENIAEINSYIEAPMTATWFAEDKHKGGGSKEQVTAELIYYWMIALNMQVDYFDKWHLNRLLTLVRVCNIKNTPPKKMSKRDVMNNNAALNAARRKSLNTRG